MRVVGTRPAEDSGIAGAGAAVDRVVACTTGDRVVAQSAGQMSPNEPPISTFDTLLPVRLTAASDPLAFMFSKPLTFTESPELWSVSDKFIVTALFTTSVSTSAPPAIDVSSPS